MNELILLVDDEPSIVKLAHIYLEREGFRIESAGDGETVFDIVARHQPALVVLEFLLPKLDGFDFYSQTRTVDVHVAHLRRKLEKSSVKLETVAGVGHKLVPAP